MGRRILILGIDPGLSGALALLDQNGKVLAIEDMPTIEIVVNGKKRRSVPPAALAAMIKNMAPQRAFLESVGVRPGEGAVGAFSFGRNLGQIEGVLAALQIPTTLVHPATWKRRMNIPADKGGARLKAMALFPDKVDLFKRVKDDGRAESALLAYYGLSNA